MKALIKKIELEDGETWALEPFCCIHKMNIGHDAEKFAQRIDAVKKDPNRYTVLMGDLADAILQGGDKRSDSNSVDWEIILKAAKEAKEEGKNPEYSEITAAYKILRQELEPVKDKILGVATGNHDYKLQTVFKTDFVKDYIAEWLDVPYLYWMWWLDLRFKVGKKEWRRYVVNGNHGAYMGRKLGGNLNRLEELPSGFDADVYLRGHTHQIGFSEKPILYLGKDGHVKQRKRYFAAVGSFLRGHCEDEVTYAEMKDYLPLDTGTITIQFDPWNDKIQFHK